MGHAVQQLGEVPGEVRVPRVGVDDRAAADRRGHLQVGGEDPQRRIGTGQARVVLGVRRRTGARLAEAVHVDVDELGQLTRQQLDVDAGTAVHVGRVLPREHPDAHRSGSYSCRPVEQDVHQTGAVRAGGPPRRRPA
jgi:hypothetical protein